MVNFAYIDIGSNGDKKIQPGESSYLDIMVKNKVNASVNIASAVLSTTSGYVTLDKSTGTLGNLAAGYYQTLTYKAYVSSSTGTFDDYDQYLLYSSSVYSSAFKFTILETCPIGTNIPFIVTFTDSWGNVWTDTFEIPVVGTGASMALNTPIANNFKVREVSGTVNNTASPNEQLYLDVMVKNSGTSKALSVSAALSTTSGGYVTLDKSIGTIGDLNAGYYQTLTYKAYPGSSSTGTSSSDSSNLLYSSSYYSSAFKFTVSASCPIGTDLPFTVTFTDSWGNVWADAFTITVE
jgi:hypothetical protein